MSNSVHLAGRSTVLYLSVCQLVWSLIWQSTVLLAYFT